MTTSARSPWRTALVERSQEQYNYLRDGFDPTVGRYTQADPVTVREHALLEAIVPSLARNGGKRIDEMPVELNPYAYVANNPVRWTDPNGTDGPGGGPGGDGGGNPGEFLCPLVGELLIAGNFARHLPHGFALLLCIYDCNRTRPGKRENVKIKLMHVFNPPYHCWPIYRPRIDEIH